MLLTFGNAIQQKRMEGQNMKKITLIALNCFLTVIFYAAYAGLPPEITYVLDNCHSQARAHSHFVGNFL